MGSVETQNQPAVDPRSPLWIVGAWVVVAAVIVGIAGLTPAELGDTALFVLVWGTVTGIVPVLVAGAIFYVVRALPFVSDDHALAVTVIVGVIGCALGVVMIVAAKLTIIGWYF